MSSGVDTSPEGYSRALEVALDNCANEAIHRIGSIQPFGVLVAADRQQQRIEFVSANLATLFPVDPEAILGVELACLLGEENTRRLQSIVAGENWQGGRIFSVELPATASRGKPGQRLDAQVFLSEQHLVLEMELPNEVLGDVFHNLFVPVRDALWKLDSESDLGRYAQLTVEQVRSLTGFDRVMMYQFDGNWDGEVIAESKVESAVSYLGNRFPASDIPPQARALYVRNLVRVISDLDTVSIPILTRGRADALDLSDSWLRSLSPVHVQYLRNMGVSASLSISLVQNGRLWGLIACHHFSPKPVGLREREMSEFIGRIVSLKLINMDAGERESLHQQIRSLLNELTELLRGSQDLDTVILLLKDKLLGLVRAAGAIFSIDGQLHAIGTTPLPEAVGEIISVLRSTIPLPVFSSDNIREMLGNRLGDDALQGVSGMMVAPLDRQMKNFVMWFRPSVLRTLRWAGNPRKDVIIDAQGPRLSPRTSFDTWIQSYQEKSNPWSQVEKDAASSLSLALIEVLAQRALKNSEESYRLLAENSTDVIARLDMSGCFLFASPACLDLFGRNCDQMIGLRLVDVIDETTESFSLLLEALAALGTMVTRVLRGRRTDGRELWVEATLRHTRGAHGESEILLNARNVTQRYNYQLALEEVHRRNSQILEATGEGLVSLDRNGYISYVNEVAAKLFGVSDHALVGRHFCAVLCDEMDCRRNEDCPFMATLRDGETRQGNRQIYVLGNRTAALLQYVCTPLLENSKITGCAIVFIEAQTAGTNEAVIATDVILDTATEAVMLTNSQGQILSVNRAFTEITGYAADEVLGKTPRILKSGVHTPHFYDELWRQLEHRGRWAGEIWNRRRNGEIYPQWGSISAILGNDGEVKNYVSVFSDISKAKQAEERLYFMANHDALTGLPNRIHFGESLSQCLQRCKRHEQGAAIIFIDLDRFKIINDTLGHSVGDQYLKLVTGRLLAATRKSDILGRWGGDEFVLVMEGYADSAVLVDTLQRLLASVSEPAHLGNQEVIPTASLGVALYPEDGLRPSELIMAADTAMYAVKQRGGNGLEFYSREMSKDLASKLKLTVELRHALHENQFFLVYQPQVDSRSETLIGVEALARWRHPQRGILPPGEFLPILEEIGLTREFGEWVLRTACSQMLTWIQRGVEVPKISVNVSPVQFCDAFVGEVAAAIQYAGVPPERIELEITEGALASAESASRVMGKLRQLGVQLAVDDFGTGYSSLSHIKLFPINCFKIDKSFVQGLPDSDADAAIVNTILALGASLRVNVIAEGAETPDQRDFLRAAGVNAIQGYIYAQPLGVEELEHWLAS